MLFGYFWLLRRKLILGSKLWLVGGSFIFYAYWNIVYVPLLLESIFVNFFIGSALGGELPSKIPKRVVLILGILFNLCLLAYFKYTDFFIENFNGLFDPDIPLTYIVLPLGISFFTFTQIAFLVDSYKGEVKEYDVLNYMLFVSYFPHLLAGPILHHAQMIPQFTNRWNWAIRWRNIATGLFLFSIGLFKKVVIADTFSEFVHQGFDIVDKLNFVEAWMTSLSYTFQIYFDFSGYTDMAIGISLMFNIRLPINFNSPYKAKNIQDFWRRWHITLSQFLREYVYIPLGGNKGAKREHYNNLAIVFFIGGLWHGAAWTFIMWGILHGCAVILHRIWTNSGLRMWDWMGWFITFNFVNFTWIFFRAEDIKSAGKVLAGMTGCNGILFTSSFSEIQVMALWIILLFVIILAFKNSMQLLDTFRSRITKVYLTAAVLLISILSLAKESAFIYFNF
ncbi:MAG: Acetyltransferase [Candidatus Poribacteria bacterium]|nr:Acetyltransferase [Candidatus Poribacteria bacterium]